MFKVNRDNREFNSIDEIKAIDWEEDWIYIIDMDTNEEIGICTKEDCNCVGYIVYG